MQKNINNEILKYLEKYNKKQVILNQLGFIESEFVFESLAYDLEDDILKFVDEKNNNIYMQINLNQAYHIDTFENNITIFLDNDTQIKLSI